MLSGWIAVPQSIAVMTRCSVTCWPLTETSATVPMRAAERLERCDAEVVAWRRMIPGRLLRDEVEHRELPLRALMLQHRAAKTVWVLPDLVRHLIDETSRA